MNNFPILIITGRPAAGKSEVIDFLKKADPRERLERFHIADFEELDPQQLFHFGIVFRDPFAGHEEGGRDLVLNQVVHQRLIVARAFSYGTEIERQRDPRAGGRA